MREKKQCKICDKFFANRSNLNKQIELVHKGNNKVKFDQVPDACVKKCNNGN